MDPSALTEIARTEQRTKHIKIESAPQVNTSRIESASTEHPASVTSALSTLRAGRRACAKARATTGTALVKHYALRYAFPKD